MGMRRVCHSCRMCCFSSLRSSPRRIAVSSAARIRRSDEAFLYLRHASIKSPSSPACNLRSLASGAFGFAMNFSGLLANGMAQSRFAVSAHAEVSLTPE